MFTMKVTTEHHDTIKVNRIPCYSAEDIASERRIQRALAPTGSTCTIEVLEGIQR